MDACSLRTTIFLPPRASRQQVAEPWLGSLKWSIMHDANSIAASRSTAWVSSWQYQPGAGMARWRPLLCAVACWQAHICMLFDLIAWAAEPTWAKRMGTTSSFIRCFCIIPCRPSAVKPEQYCSSLLLWLSRGLLAGGQLCHRGYKLVPVQDRRNCMHVRRTRVRGAGEFHFSKWRIHGKKSWLLQATRLDG